MTLASTTLSTTLPSLKKSSMPPLPLLGFIFLLLSDAASVSAHSCHSISSSSSSSCPPFKSTPPFPFSSSPGCGHPAFHLKCSTPYSTISIANLSFTLRSYDPNSSTLLLSPQPSPTTIGAITSLDNCSSLHFLSIPSRSINFSASPFRVSDSSCSRISVLRACSPLKLPNCSHCPWDCKLIKDPLRLIHGCGITHSPLSPQGCQSDVVGYLDEYLRRGIEVEFDVAQDSYFSSCRDCQVKNGVCGFNDTDPSKQFICFPSKSRFSPPWIREENPNLVAILCTIFALACLLIAVAVGATIFRSRRVNSLAIEEDPTTVFLRRHRSASLLPPVFTYEELEASTNKFDPKRKLGDGGFGSVYLGQLTDGRIVAVKYLHTNKHAATANGRAFSAKSFCNEILILSSINHQNLVRLHGYCSDARGLLLVYDYVPNGTLADHLHGPKSVYRKGSLTWQVRFDIAFQIALAVEYLHFAVKPPIVHRDITSSNIFVEKDMRVKVGDFGLSRLLVFPETSGFVWTGPQGTPGYLDPDYHSSFRLTEKSDVYSFGVVLLELITGLKAVDQNRDKSNIALADLVVTKIQMGLLHQVVDPVLEDSIEVVEAVAELAFRCVAAEKDDRPHSKEVVEELRRIRGRTRGLRGTISNLGGDVANV
ncbi:serine/threonine-protein kinase [Tripterygium wilfordii]|uniref:Serine/threonine-protein kinase n=1 Tax=Tripterygium wilfordii TaxID=458696 RepID=A0A7J7DK13_TRIWF|nr:LEAF RUST 10 DISEASE-RESISTANCE LOCUS RECEPTOR-LIKE PROTEIN KINASE-like 1.5 [Tripterygium wilfordii]KAF5746667.1 serine/threonine-protein kinase [Tripterygium wilfordii]